MSDNVYYILRLMPNERACEILGNLPYLRRAADGQAHHKDFSLGAGLRRDHLKFVPGVHRVAELEMAGG
jgi:hypothetical protein